MRIAKRLIWGPLLASLLINTSSSCVTLIFDLNGVLFTTHMISCIKLLGTPLISYLLTTGKSPSALKKKLYKIMHEIHATETDAHCPFDDEGIRMPFIMQAWKRGILTH